MKKTVVALSPLIRPLLEGRLPDWVEPRWFANADEAVGVVPDAEVGWLDLRDRRGMLRTIEAAKGLKWMNTFFTGVDGLPLQLLAERGVVMTNGSGLNAITIAEYVVMGMLTIAKGYRQIVRAQDRHEWLREPPGRVELFGSRALILGAGAIGKLVEERLRAFQVDVSVARRTPDATGRTLGPDQWRGRLGEFDWIIVTVPATDETRHLLGRAEFAAMKPSAVVLNIARGSIIDQAALTEALREQRIGGAFLDVTDPEPLPADDPLWSLPNAHITMHLSGLSQTLMMKRAGQRFLENLERYRQGQPLEYQVDLALGY